MAITDFRSLRRVTGVTVIAASPALRVAAIAVIHAAALLAVCLTEYGPFATTLALLSWAFLNFFWLMLLRRPAMAAALSLVMIVSMIVLSRFKYDIMEMTLSFLDVLVVDADTVAFLLTIFPDLRPALAAAAIVAVPLLILLWRLDPFRLRRRTSSFGAAVSLAGMTALADLDLRHHIPDQLEIDLGDADTGVFAGAGERQGHAGLEDLVRIGHRRLHADVARVGRDLRFDGGDLAFEFLTGIGVDHDPDDLTDLERATVLFSHGEVGVDLRQVGQGHDLRSRRQVLTDFHLADAEFAVEGRLHQLLRDDGLGPGNAGVSLVERRLRLVDGCLRPELTRGQLLGAVKRELRHGRLGLEAGKVALLGGIEQLHERRTFLHAGARGEHETTTNLIGNGLVALLHHPAEKRRLIENRELIKTAIEEMLRFESSNQLGNRMRRGERHAVQGAFEAGRKRTRRRQAIGLDRAIRRRQLQRQ